MHTVSVYDVIVEQGTSPVGHRPVVLLTRIVSRKVGPPRFAQAILSEIDVILIGGIGGITRPLHF